MVSNDSTSSDTIPAPDREMKTKHTSPTPSLHQQQPSLIPITCSISLTTSTIEKYNQSTSASQALSGLLLWYCSLM